MNTRKKHTMDWLKVNVCFAKSTKQTICLTWHKENRYEDVFVGAYSGKWIFIRFNPDAYTDSEGKKRKGMFDSKGRQYGDEVKRRKELLIHEIKKKIERIESDKNTELLEITKLFYDGF